MGAEYSQCGDECNFLLFPKPGVKNAPAPRPHLSPLSRTADFDISCFFRNALKPLYDDPSHHRNTCFKFVCLPLPSFSSFPSISSTWSLGMFTLKLVFQDSSSFLSSISKSSVLFEGSPCHLCTLSVCTSVSSCPCDERLEHPWEWALAALTQARPGLLGCCVSFSTLNWQWVPTLTFKLQVYSEVCCKWGSQPKVSRFSVKGKCKLFKRLDSKAITHTQYFHVTFQSGKPHLLMYWPSSTMQIKPI